MSVTPAIVLGDSAGALPLTQAVGDGKHQPPVRRRPIDETFGLDGLDKAESLTIVLRPAGEIAAHLLKVDIIKIAEMTNPLTLEPPFQLDEDGAAQHRVGHLLALARDRLWSECRKHPRLVGIGIATEYAGPRSPPAVLLLAAAASIGLGLGSASAGTEVVIQYPYPDLFNETHKQLRAAFAKERPDIEVTFRAAYKDYEDATQRVLREAVTGNVPDITL